MCSEGVVSNRVDSKVGAGEAVITCSNVGKAVSIKVTPLVGLRLGGAVSTIPVPFVGDPVFLVERKPPSTARPPPTSATAAIAMGSISFLVATALTVAIAVDLALVGSISFLAATALTVATAVDLVPCAAWIAIACVVAGSLSGAIKKCEETS